MDRTILITGAARGLGFEMCRQLLARKATVVACPRKEGEPDLTALAGEYPERLHVVPMDVSDPDSRAAAAERVSGRLERIDVLINNAGVYPRCGSVAGGLDEGMLRDAFHVNAVAPLKVVETFLPLLRKGKHKRLVQVTSLMGSVEDNTSGGSYAYRMSKAALNMATRNLAHELGPEGFLAFAIHPGWVRTRMGGNIAPLEIEPAVAAILRVAFEARAELNGAFLSPDGTRLPY